MSTKKALKILLVVYVGFSLIFLVVYLATKNKKKTDIVNEQNDQVVEVKKPLTIEEKREALKQMKQDAGLLDENGNEILDTAEEIAVKREALQELKASAGLLDENGNEKLDTAEQIAEKRARLDAMKKAAGIVD